MLSGYALSWHQFIIFTSTVYFLSKTKPIWLIFVSLLEIFIFYFLEKSYFWRKVSVIHSFRNQMIFNIESDIIAKSRIASPSLFLYILGFH